ncbi:MAG: hypothetical protein WC897_06170 [Candidatus Gracilibacteria bacterium]
MHINKIIKIYFLFVMTIATIGGIGQAQLNGDSLLSVLHIMKNPSTDFKFSVVNFLPKTIKDQLGDRLPTAIVAPSEEEDTVTFAIQNDPGSAFATAGAKNKKVMEFVIGSDQGKVDLKNLRLKISGVHPLAIEKTMLVVNGKEMSEGRQDSEYLLFNGIDLEVEKGKKETLELYMDLSEGLQSGDRIRPDVEDANDIFLTLDGKPYDLKKKFPIKGRYLSIIRYRPWYDVVRVKASELKKPINN